jgi:hypothetical protein
MIHFYNLYYYKKSLHGKNNNGCFCFITMNLDSRTDMEDDDEKIFDCLTSEIVALVSTEIAAEHHRKYCNKTPKRTSP